MSEFRSRRDRIAVESRPTTSWRWVLFIMVAMGMFGAYILYLARGIELEYSSIDTLADKTAAAGQMKIELPYVDSPLHLPDLALLSPHHPWMYVSKSSPLSKSYKASNLVTTTLPHSDSDSPVQLESRTNQKLSELFTAAEKDGINLMIASAYRSIEDQQKLYDAFVEKRGEAAAKQYVALPGTSEHHTGYAVDVDNASSACQKDSDKCELNSASIAWLDENAPRYGFIIRFPALKEPVTGTAYEPWHLRYVGVIMAKKATQSGLAYDEIIEQIAPGRIR